MLAVLLILCVFSIGVYSFTGLYIVQPIGALPEGVTIWYFRSGTNLPFITSPDGFLLQNQGSVSLLSRAVVFGTLTKIVLDRKIARFPYMKSLYLISTDGKDFEK